ncbi:MAG TPA: SsrA-binding protein SmpB [Bdellovibrionota bacterium]|nr:SsrA-binding protein SmpB [Bdellovibrionota bacterium]
MAEENKSGLKIVAVNRHARHDFFILESFEAGIELKGSEVKSIREGTVNLKEGFAHVHKREILLEGVHISPYSHANQFGHEPVRTRRLLMHRREINRIEADLQQQRLTLVPLRLYFKKGRVKVEIGLAKGKKLHDKREAIKEKESIRSMERAQRSRKP